MEYAYAFIEDLKILKLKSTGHNNKKLFNLCNSEFASDFL